MIFILSIISILSISVIGYIIIEYLKLLNDKRFLYKLSFGYGLGIGALYFQMYLYSRIGISWNLLSILMPWIILIILFLVKNPVKKVKVINKLNFSDYILVLGIVFSSIYTIFQALLRPLVTWDGWANWILKSNAFYLDSGIFPSTLQYIRSDGPLIISTIGSYLYIFINGINDTQVLLISSGFYVFLNIAFFSILRDRFSLKYSLLFTLFFSSTQAFIRQGGRFEAGQADLALGYYFLTTTVLLLQYLKDKNTNTLILLAIFLLITSLIKLDATPYVIFISLIILISIYLTKKYIHSLILLIWIVPFIEWQFYKESVGLGNIYFKKEGGHQLIFYAPKIKNALLGVTKDLINIKTWSLTWIVYTISLFSKIAWKNRELLIINLIILSQLAVYIFLYFFVSGNDPHSSVTRLLVHLAPLAMIQVAYLYKKI